MIKGLISPLDLRFALAVQKSAAQPLGKVLLDHSMITRGELRTILIRQNFLRVITGAVLFSTTFLSDSRAKADITDAAARISVAATNSQTNFTPVSAYPEFLGTAEKRSTNLSAFTKWTGMFARFEREIDNQDSQPTIRQWRQSLIGFRDLPLLSMAQHVNDLMNEHPYIRDSRNWGVNDYWETPVEFLTRGGDCEDFAIVKYLSLRALGVPEERMRVAIVQDTQKNIPHAVLALYADDGVYILDNQNKAVFNAGHQGRYRPIFSINRTAWWLHTTPDVTQMAAR